MKIVVFVSSQKNNTISTSLKSIQRQNMQEKSFLKKPDFYLLMVYDENLDFVSARILYLVFA